jgi:hypothetical protein
MSEYSFLTFISTGSASRARDKKEKKSRFSDSGDLPATPMEAKPTLSGFSPVPGAAISKEQISQVQRVLVLWKSLDYVLPR